MKTGKFGHDVLEGRHGWEMHLYPDGSAGLFVATGNETGLVKVTPQGPHLNRKQVKELVKYLKNYLKESK